MFRKFVPAIVFLLLEIACVPVDQTPQISSAVSSSDAGIRIAAPMDTLNAWQMPADLPQTEAQWKQRLTAEQYHILREQGTEVPFTSELLHEKRKGTYVTADCDEPVFRSETKFDSGTGWPSFWAPIPGSVIEKTDATFGLTRTEILSKCGGHLGHVFEDGPAPTGLRYCMNGDALKFVPDPDQ